MTNDEFCRRVMLAFQGGDKASRERFSAMLVEFSGRVKPETLDHVCHAAETGKFGSYGKPNMGDLITVAAEVEPSVKAARQSEDGRRYAYRCRGVLERDETGRVTRECRTLLSRNVSCPVCGNHARHDVVLVGEGTRTIGAQEDCYRCTLYREEFRRHGPTCDRFGYHDAGEMCRDCRCSPCCSMRRRLRGASPQALKRLRDTDYPWLYWPRDGESRPIPLILADLAANATRWDD